MEDGFLDNIDITQLNSFYLVIYKDVIMVGLNLKRIKKK